MLFALLIHHLQFFQAGREATVVGQKLPLRAGFPEGLWGRYVSDFPLPAAREQLGVESQRRTARSEGEEEEEEDVRGGRGTWSLSPRGGASGSRLAGITSWSQLASRGAGGGRRRLRGPQSAAKHQSKHPAASLAEAPVFFFVFGVILEPSRNSWKFMEIQIHGKSC